MSMTTEAPSPRSARGRRRTPPSARIPLATYRIQFNRAFTFNDARRWAEYLHDLGISDVYASPYLRASAESTHGYDVANHNELNPAIGSEKEYDAFVAELHRLGMGQVLDIVPNHMGIAEKANTWWMDVLENGPSSPYAIFFDITWDSLKPELRDKVLLPILGDQYGVVLENAELQVAYAEGSFCLHYWETELPIAPRSYSQILQPCLGALAARLEPADERLLELQSILTAISHLPTRSETAFDRIAERQREKEVIKRRLATLVEGSSEVRDALEATLRVVNGVKGQPASFDLLDALLNEQAYRLAFWRVASEEINYRRFFDVNQLAAIRVEEPEVFRETHRLILRLLREGKVTGLRIDHPDGLRDPAGYLRQLQVSYLEEVSPVRLAAEQARPPAKANGHVAHPTPRLPDPIEEQFAAGRAGASDLPLYVVVEKILSGDEELRPDWPTHGTTGYDFANDVGGIFVDRSNRRAFDELYARFIDRKVDYRDLVNSTKKMIMLISLASEVNALAHRLDRLSERNRRIRDFTLNSLTFAIREVIAALPIYRTYTTCDGPLARPDREAIEAAVADAKRRNPRTERSIFDFIRDLLLQRYPAGTEPDDRAVQCEFVMKFQQTTGPVMAKGAEDTAFYVYNRLVSLNEVGGEPDRFGLSVEDFHKKNLARLERWPHSLLGTSTHDTKRSEDVRARISVLSEIPREWSAALGRWSRFNARHKRRVGGFSAPDRNDEYLIYQTLLGAWPFDMPDAAAREQFLERIQAYMLKAMKEAKVRTSWISPNEEYEQATAEFIRLILDEEQSVNFLASFRPLQLKVARFGVFNSLAQTLLKLTAPGVPDIYQGMELFDFSLVDPDNRRPVDYTQRARLLRSLRQEVERREPKGTLADLAHTLIAQPEDGRAKLYVIHRALQLRREHPDLFRRGSYEPLEASGDRADHVFAFARTERRDRVVIVTPRLLTGITPEQGLPLGPETWSNARLVLTGDASGTRYRDLFSGQTLAVESRDGAPGLDLATVFAQFPLALLERTR